MLHYHRRVRPIPISFRTWLLVGLCLFGLPVVAVSAAAETVDRAENDVEPDSAEPADDRSIQRSNNLNDSEELSADSDARVGSEASEPSSRGPCVELIDPLPPNGCYKFVTTVRPGCPVSIRCGASSGAGKKYCRITYGGGEIKCETYGGSCGSA